MFEEVPRGEAILLKVGFAGLKLTDFLTVPFSCHYIC